MKFNLFKKTVLFVLLSTLMLSVAACGNKTTQTAEVDEVTAFIEAEDGYNLSILNAVEKYGSACIEIEQYFVEADKTVSFIEYADKDSAFYYNGENDIYLLYEGVTYRKGEFDGTVVYCIEKTYKDDSLVTIEDYIDVGFYFASEEDYDRSVVKNEDGTYTWISSYATGNDETDKSYATATINLNEDYEMTEWDTVYYNEDGSVYCNETCKYTVGVENTAVRDEFVEQINAANGATRNVNVYEVTDGNSEKAWTVTVPVGIGLIMNFPEDYFNEDGKVVLYTDATLTTEATSTDLYSDADCYLPVVLKK